MNNTVPHAILRSFIVLALGLAAICPITAVAQPTYYFPGSNVNYTGGSNSFPLNSTSSNKCQWLYKSTDFNSAPPGAFLITTIYIKPSTTKSSFTFSNLTIKLGNTTLTTLSSGAWLTGLTSVYNPSSVTVGTTANQWKAFTLSTPFFYSGGNLLLEISHTTSSSSGISLNQFSVTGRTGRKYGSASSSNASGVDAATALFGFDGVPASCTGTPAAPIITTTSMSTANPICAGSTKSLTATDPNAPITNITYQWQSANSPAGPFNNVTNGSGATTLNYTTGPLLSTTWFRMGAKCTGSGITSYSAPYQVIVGAQQPGIISGAPTSCPGDTATYSVPLVAGHSYTWTLPTGWSGSSTTNSILVTPGSGGGTISVTATGCGGISIARTKAISVGNAPPAPALSGSDHVCANSTQTYSVPPVAGATSYTWSLPTGWTGSSTSNSITVIAGAAGGSVKAKANNGCGSSVYTTKNVTIISSLASPGTITSNAVGGIYCSGVLYNFSISPVSGATAYVWSLPSGWSGTNTGTSIQAFAGNSGQVQVTAYVSCATSPTASLTTTVSPTVTPSVSLAPNSSILCQGKPVTFTATPTNGGSNPTYFWKKNGTAVFASGNTYTSAGLANGELISVGMTSNAQCLSSDTVISGAYTANVTPSVTPGISINSNPVITICEGTQLHFSTIRTGGGTAPTYQWHINGTPITGATDTSFSNNSFVNGDTLTVTMTTNATCATIPKANSNNVSITVKDTLHPNVTIYSSSVLAGQPITFSAVHYGGGETPDYQWRLNNVDIPGASDDTYLSPALEAGDRISIRMQSYAECAQPNVVTSEEVIILGPTSVGSVPHWNGTLRLFPNPNTGRFTIAATQRSATATERISVDVYNIIGQQVYHQELTTAGATWHQEVQLDGRAPAGQYHVRITAEDGSSANIPMILSR
jgi:hypothetical protein